MADYSWATKVTYRHEWTVPVHSSFGACIAEFHKASHAAHQAYLLIHGLSPEKSLSDDYLRVDSDDENIIIFFETDFPPPRKLCEQMLFNYNPPSAR